MENQENMLELFKKVEQFCGRIKMNLKSCERACVQQHLQSKHFCVQGDDDQTKTLLTSYPGPYIIIRAQTSLLKAANISLFGVKL